jgi:hypothetical protein
MEALARPTEIERDYLVNVHQGNTLLVPMIEIWEDSCQALAFDCNLSPVEPQM